MPSPPQPYQTVQTLGGTLYAIPDARSSTKIIHLFDRINDALGLVWVILGCLWARFLPTQQWRDHVQFAILRSLRSSFDTRIQNQRKLLLKSIRGKVLDVGSGGLGGWGSSHWGILTSASHVVVLEPMTALHPLIQTCATNAGLESFQITIVEETIERYAENQRGSFDWILVDHGLGQTPDVTGCLQAVNHLLKPGGYVYFAEHIAIPKGTWMRRVQDFLNPCFRAVTRGCNINRDLLIAIEGVAEWEVVSWKFEHLTIALAPLVMVLGRKIDVDV